MIPTSNPHRDAEEYYDLAEAEQERRDERRRTIRQELESGFYESLENSDPLPGGDTNTLFDLVCNDLESVKLALDHLARIRKDDPVARGILNDLCDSYVKSISPDVFLRTINPPRKKTMKTTLRQRLRRAHPFIPDVPRSTIKHNRRQWLKSVQLLGEKWVALKQIKRGQS